MVKNAAEWIKKRLYLIILIILGSIVGIYRLIRSFGVDGLIVFFVILAGALFLAFGYDRYYRWRSNRLAQSILPGEVLLAGGLVSESISDETPAIIVRGYGNLYRVHIADSRGRQTVLSVSPELTHHANIRDVKLYIEIHTDQGIVHFAPRKEFFVAGQYDYAQEVLNELLVNGVAPKGLPRGA